jgi:hypothetical protein
VINITRNSSNDVVVTTTEYGTSTYYLFQLKSDTTEIMQYCVAQDTSAFPNRFNKFEITEVGAGTATPTNAELKLGNDGQWQYFIYANSSASNLDPTGLALLEQGIVKVTGTPAPSEVYTGGNQTYTVYGE